MLTLSILTMFLFPVLNQCFTKHMLTLSILTMFLFPVLNQCFTNNP